MDISKVNYVVMLQQAVDTQIKELGKADSVMVEELMVLADSLNDEEIELVLKKYKEL